MTKTIHALPQDATELTADDILNEIRTVFQPIIDLSTRQTVGYEALSRGPKHTAYEDPIALIEWAKRNNCLGLLDWTCRATALHTALLAHQPETITWFINVEPGALHIPCPTHLRPAFRHASRKLRIMLEITERHDERDTPALIDLAGVARRNGWGIALDDVGANPASLPLIPLLEPDIVKLDASLLASDNKSGRIAVKNALDTYARDGHRPRLLAEGVETEAHEDLALRFFQATYGQGYRYGHPQPLASRPPRSHAAILRVSPNPNI